MMWPRVVKNPKMVTNLIHGMKGHPLYDVYRGMIRRCYQKDHRMYHRYGGRGITVCLEWIENRSAFFSWALSHGWERGLTLDREDTDGNYCPSNCRFVSTLINNENKSGGLRVADAAVIKSLAVLGVDYRIVSALYGITHSQMFNIKRGSRWPTVNEFLLTGEVQ
jgi:hypothetical protein